MKKTLIFCVFFLALSVAAYCGQVSRIELTDGSVLNGEILSFSNGVYTINTASFGQLTVPMAKIYKIESQGAFSAGAQAGSGEESSDQAQQINAYKERVMNNPASAAVISDLAGDPRIQDMAQDPEILEAAKSGNMQALMKNKKFIDVVNDPNVQEKAKKLE